MPCSAKATGGAKLEVAHLLWPDVFTEEIVALVHICKGMTMFSLTIDAFIDEVAFLREERTTESWECRCLMFVGARDWCGNGTQFPLLLHRLYHNTPVAFKELLTYLWWLWVRWYVQNKEHHEDTSLRVRKPYMCHAIPSERILYIGTFCVHVDVRMLVNPF